MWKQIFLANDSICFYISPRQNNLQIVSVLFETRIYFDVALQTEIAMKQSNYVPLDFSRFKS